jgi:hypothetical protein
MRVVTVNTKQGIVVISSESVTVPRKMLGSLSAFGLGREIPFSEIHSVSVGGNNKQYMTGNRAAGALLTGGVALLAPTKIRGELVIGLKDGEVLSYQLKRGDAKRPQTIAMAFDARGVTVV